MHTSRLASAYLCIICAIHIICCSAGLSFAFAKILIWIERCRTHNREVLQALLITNRMNAVIFLFSERPAVTQKSLLRIFRVLTFEQISWVLFLVYNFNMRNLAFAQLRVASSCVAPAKADGILPSPAAPKAGDAGRDHKRVEPSHGPIIITLCLFSVPDVSDALPAKRFVIVCMRVRCVWGWVKP